MIYVQTSTGLQNIGQSLTKERIISALGYTPADGTNFYEDESGALIVADNKGYIIARIDENGLCTTQVSANAVVLNGEDLSTKLASLISNYYTKDEVETVVKNAEPNLTNYATKAFVETAINNLDIPEADLSKYALSADVEANKVITDAHAEDEEKHTSQTEKAYWNNKSEFSGNYQDLHNVPHIINENEDELVVCDSAGNVILRATAEGLHATAIYMNGVAMTALPDWSEAAEGAVLTLVNGVPTWV